jgi:hypothetical protein
MRRNVQSTRMKDFFLFFLDNELELKMLNSTTVLEKAMHVSKNSLMK